MTRALRLVVVSGLLALLLAVLAGRDGAEAASPFYLVPSGTKECRKVKNCVGAVGPWVAVPASGEATFLFSCPSRRNFIVGGTDARASSSKVRVWFDGRVGAPIGAPPSRTEGRAVLLFHAATSDGRQGWFQPILGCVSLTQKTKRSTVSVLPGTRPSAPLDLRADNVELRLDRELLRRTRTLRCPKGEALVGSWSAFAVRSSNPPGRSLADAVSIGLVVARGEVRASFRRNRSFGHLVPLASVQIGAMCVP